MTTRANAAWERVKAHRLAFTLLILVTLAVGILIGSVVSYGVKGKEPSRSPSDATALTVPAPQQLSSTFTQIAKQMEPAVVNINTESTIKPVRRRGGGRSIRPPRGEDQSPFDDFFDRFFGGQGTGPGLGGDGEAMRARSLGSGVILDSKGYIVTNAHVVEKADRIRVHLMGEPPMVLHNAKVIGKDEETDLAVIKIDVDKPLTSAKLGNSDGMNPGDWVLAVGSPFGLEETVTAGIVSARGRNNIVPQKQFQSFIQTDAAINPGNSGGPLVNMAGEVVGINTAILTERDSYAGVGFALPSNTVAQVYNQLIGPEHKVMRGSIGVTFQAEANPAVARVYGVKSGVTIADVTPGGPAAAAGLKVGDTIIAIDGKPIKTGDELVTEISSRKPGSKVRLGYVRNGQPGEATLTTADRAKLFAERLGESEDEGEEKQPAESKLGITVRPLTPDIADRLQVPAGKGVIVQDVRPGGFADDSGLSRGDVILEVNRQPVNNEDDFRKVTSGLRSGQDVVFLVRQRRAGGTGTIFLGGTLP